MTIFKKIVTDIYIVSWALFKVLIPTLIVVKIAEMAGAVYWLNVAMAPIVTMKTVRAAIGFHNFARTDMPNRRAATMTINIAIREREKWNCPTLTVSDTRRVKLSENPKIEMPLTKNTAPFDASESRSNMDVTCACCASR